MPYFKKSEEEKEMLEYFRNEESNIQGLRDRIKEKERHIQVLKSKIRSTEEDIFGLKMDIHHADDRIECYKRENKNG